MFFYICLRLHVSFPTYCYAVFGRTAACCKLQKSSRLNLEQSSGRGLQCVWCVISFSVPVAFTDGREFAMSFWVVSVLLSSLFDSVSVPILCIQNRHKVILMILVVADSEHSSEANILVCVVLPDAYQTQQYQVVHGDRLETYSKYFPQTMSLSL